MVDLIIVSICIVLLVYLFHLSRRNGEGFNFRMYLLYKYGADNFKKLDSYSKMVYSFKPLEEKFWLK